MFVCPCARPSVWLTGCLCVCLSIWTSVSVWLSVCTPCVCLTVCLHSVCLSDCLCIGTPVSVWLSVYTLRVCLTVCPLELQCPSDGPSALHMPVWLSVRLHSLRLSDCPSAKLSVCMSTKLRLAGPCICMYSYLAACSDVWLWLYMWTQSFIRNFNRKISYHLYVICVTVLQVVRSM